MRRYAIRFAFGAATSVIAGLVTLLHGAVSGGVFLAFPAILAATLTLLEQDKGPVAAVADSRGALVGALGLAAFASVVVALGGRLNPAAVLAVAMAAWIGVSLALYTLGTGGARLLHVERYPPEVPVSTAEPLVTALRRGGQSLIVVDAGAGGALAAVLTELPHSADVVRGAVVAADVGSACRLLDLDAPAADRPASDALAMRLAAAARERWRADVALALLGSEGQQLPLRQAFHVAVDTARGADAKAFEADRGGEGNWGEAVLIALRFTGEAAASLAGRGQRDSTSSRMPVRSSPSMEMSMNEGTQTRSMPPGAT